MESKKLSDEDLYLWIAGFISRVVHRKEMTMLIRSLMIEHPLMHYYQGFHDIIEFLMIYSKFNINWTYTMMKRLMESYLRFSYVVVLIQ